MGADIIKRYDENGFVNYYEFPDGYKVWLKRDKRGHIIEYKDSENYWYKQEYNSRGNMIHRNDEIGDHYYEYDNNGNLIHRKCSNGYECWYLYDENNKMTYHKDNINHIWQKCE